MTQPCSVKTFCNYDCNSAGVDRCLENGGSKWWEKDPPARPGSAVARFPAKRHQNLWEDFRASPLLYGGQNAGVPPGIPRNRRFLPDPRGVVQQRR